MLNNSFEYNFEKLFSITELYYKFYKITNIPIVFDYHNHKFYIGSLNEE